MSLALVVTGGAQPSFAETSQTDSPAAAMMLDLVTALKLAGADNVDIQIARARLQEAQAEETSATWRFLPWISAGVTYRRHEHFTQDVAGNIVDVHKRSYAPGVVIAAEIDLGEAWYNALAARQKSRAEEQGLASQRQKTVVAAADAYFDLVSAQANVAIAEESLRISRTYETELGDAVKIGLALRADELRVRVSAQRRALEVRQAHERRRVAAARLAQVLRIDPTTELIARDEDMVPLKLVPEDSPLSGFVEQALQKHPEIKQSEAQVEASTLRTKEAKYGPLVPSLGGQASLGWLGGGPDGGPERFGGAIDYVAFLQWRLGPGGLLDQGQVRVANARQAHARGTAVKVRDEVVRQVVEAHTALRSNAEQMTTAKSALAIAEESLDLSRQRKEFAVANVLENIAAEEALTRARSEYVRAVAGYNRAQYQLKRATGDL